ncbi:MAG: tetratricopeptide repeat protein, partial [Anaerolineaceae bacterium]|nr:tetratricopeptide repeat protein [Anaerolineaceae bacterium]
EQTPEDVKQSIAVLLERSRLTWKLEGAQAALPFVRDLASLASDKAEVMALLAQVLAEGGDSNGAAEAIQKSLRLNPEQPALNRLMGDIQHKSGQLDQAIHYFSEAIRQNPLEPTAFVDLAGVYLERREYTQALNTYHKAMAVCSDDPRPYLLAAQVMRECKDYPGAEEFLRKAAELAPKDVNIRRQLGAIIALNLVHHSQEAHAQR